MQNQRGFPYRRVVTWGSILVGLVVILVLLNIAKNIYTDLLWFDDLGYRSVYTKALTTRIWLFFAGALAFVAAFAANVVLAARLARRDEPSVLPPETIQLIRSLTRLGLVLLAIALALAFGAAAAGQWENFLRFTHAQAFVDGQGVPLSDPLNGQNPSFYIFKLPLIRFVQTWLLGLVMTLIVGAAAIYAMGFSLRGFRLGFSRSVKVHLSVLVAALALVVAWSFWFDAKELVLAQRALGGSLFGAGYTDVTAKLFALRFMMGVSSLVAVMAVVSAFRQGIVLPIAAGGLWIASAIFVLLLYPTAYQRFSVEPNELVRETPYIDHNIQSTRLAFGLDKIDVSHFPTTDALPSESAVRVPAIIDNVRLWDHRPLKDTLNQIQFFRTYYTFQDVDIDRYEVDGQVRQVMVSARELSSALLPVEAQNWVAKRLQYTHGYGVAMSPVNEFTAEGRPNFFIKDVPPKGNIELNRPEIYFGEKAEGYVIVNSGTQEFDYPSEQGVPQFTHYLGAGGVQLSSFIRKAALAWKFLDFNLLISQQVTPQSRILYIRNVQDRIKHIAPFLTLDHDPYIVAAGGKLWWIQDAYTTTRRFPYSQPYSKDFNYIRNSVKAVVDPYTGAASFYVADPSDAIVQTYMSIFPTLFQSLDHLPAELKDHLRYPEGLFDVQAYMYRTYHVTDARVFISKEDIWSRPMETFYGAPQAMESYYLIMPVPGESKPEFLLLLPFTPLNKPNLVGWMAARSDGDHYGQLVAYTFPKDKQVDGPAQVEARINNDPLISQQFTLWGQQGSQIIRGNLLVIPVAGSLLYVEPVYLQASTLNFPELKRVIVAIGASSPVMEPSLNRALDVAFGEAPPTLPSGGPGTPTATPRPGTPQPTPGPGTPQATPGPRITPTPDLDALIKQLESLLEQLKRLRGPGQ